ncbi:hypothetical protein [uncultured Eudoraea sp.]|uniref:hypothetical protein n=1 Tax=uncultured Eudoraea sp. TaxID=1035614 RepID=UPI002633AAFD|nr:hypothetical protein [uncultured Eudoraea sp.]
MKSQTTFIFLLLNLSLGHFMLSQQAASTGFNETTELFKDQEELSIRLKFSTKNLRANTNDSTYIASTLWYKDARDLWDSIDIKLRARGNFRRNNCYYVPLRIKIKKSKAKGTIFEGNKKLKVVLPCLEGRNGNDYVLKEYLAYKLYEDISPYHFKTRLVDLEFLEEKGQRIKEHRIQGFLIEDIDNVAERVNGKQIKRIIHPLQHDAVYAVENAFFEYMIGNTDYSSRVQHNQRLLFIDDKIISVPYDFDMSGLVNTHYATVSNIQNIPVQIDQVTQRAYKGYMRDEEVFQKVRQTYLAHKERIFAVVDGLKIHFRDAAQLSTAEDFITSFYKILEDDKKFERNIIKRTRTK